MRVPPTSQPVAQTVPGPNPSHPRSGASARRRRLEPPLLPPPLDIGHSLFDIGCSSPPLHRSALHPWTLDIPCSTSGVPPPPFSTPPALSPSSSKIRAHPHPHPFQLWTLQKNLASLPSSSFSTKQTNTIGASTSPWTTSIPPSPPPKPMAAESASPPSTSPASAAWPTSPTPRVPTSP